MAAIMIVPIWLATVSGDFIEIKVVDESGLFENKFPSNDKIGFVYVKQPLADAKAEFLQSKKGGLLYIPKIDIEKPSGIAYYSDKNPSAFTQGMIEKTIEREIENLKMARVGIEKSVIDGIRANVSLQTVSLGDEGEKQSSSMAATGIGYFTGFLIYMFIFLYGTQVMRGVLEEKTNRIVEVMISSVKPFQLMLGKIVGIGAVALTQFIIWIVLSFAVSSALSSAYQLDRFSNTQIDQTLGQMENAKEIENAMDVNAVVSAIETINFPLVIGAFLFYFLMGYLTFAAFFAAVGAAVDNETDSQQFIIPVTVPLILAIMVISPVLQDPTSQIAFWFSIFPLTSPIIMMVRLPFIGFTWELLLSMGLLVGAFLGAVWLTARIYRIGILMYGKKPTYKEISKWIFYKG
jgi:ABC-2 type transport system permease protein